MLPIQQHNNWTMFAAFVLVAVSVIRVPVADGYFRPLFQLIAETGVFLLFAAFIFIFVNRWWGLFLALVIFSTIYPNFGKWSYMARGVIVAGCIWYTLLALTVKDPTRLLDALCIIAIANILFANLQNCGFDPYKIATFGAMSSTTGHPTGLMANKNILSALLAFSLPAFFRKGWAWFVPFVFFGLTIASSSGGAVAATVMVVVYFFLKDGRDALIKNPFKVVALAAWFCFFSFGVDPPVTIEIERDGERAVITHGQEARTETWTKGLQLYKQRPFFGFGIGHWKLIFKNMAKPGTSVMVQAHNEFVQGLFEMGVLFPVIILGYFVSTIRRYKKEAILPVTALGIIALNSIVNFPFHVATTAIIAVTCMAILELQLRPQLKEAV